MDGTARPSLPTGIIPTGLDASVKEISYIRTPVS